MSTEGMNRFSDDFEASSPSTASLTCALVPYSFRSPFHDALRDATRWFPIVGKRIQIDQAWQSDGRGGTTLGFGASVYDSAIALSLYLAAHRDLVKEKRVIELGCGPGLVGIVAAHLEPSSVVMTDGDPVSITLTQRNMKVNRLSEDICTAETYLWGDLDHRLVPKVGARGPYDVILGADIVACPYVSSFEALMTSLRALAGPMTLVLLAYKKRQNLEEKFFDTFNKVFDVEPVDKSELHPDFQEGGDIMIFQARLRNP
ncbi:unnamed protein product [Peronospora belbahrii]|uniref:Uncharacterized protein n=1 Tax=Peronospora belbahrii TaxID=622444 RepID=A0AAU9KV72_9STRA|nr:unnamed protein product [Peronospora belbahrii]CAH0517925.1 unnamed protein product [Peronospora belbahrii]